ncbi:stage II sporulation protein D [Ruminococcaceae bacterium FB2012]|nr:stage II sporulation protein D [Ruminococcaceae bacterium FB2012]
MDQKRKTLITRAAAAAAGVTAAMFVGMMFPTDKGSVSADLGSVKSANTAVSASVTADKSASEETADKMPAFIEYRKADIHEYKMASISSTPLVPLSSNEVKADEEEQSEETVQEDFTVMLPEDGTVVYDNKPSPLNYTATRSVADEYFTVKDLISGCIVTKNAHEMLCMMVFNEIGANWDEEAIKAQVVAAYTHLRYNDMIDHIPTIALKPGYPDKIERCVRAVEGQAVFYDGSIINAAYAASTAGYSADSSAIFGIAYPYLKPVVSQYDEDDPNWGCTVKISPETISKAFASKYGIVLSDDYKNWFTVLSMHSGRYVGSVSIDGGRATVSGADMRSLLKLKSSAFEINFSGGMFTFKTYGYGHGVGMSQWGAKLYADHGWTYDQILRHYYVGTTVSLTNESSKAVERGYKPPEKIVIPEDEKEEEQSFAEQGGIVSEQESKSETKKSETVTEEKKSEEKKSEEKKSETKTEDKKPESQAEEKPAEEAAPETEASTEQTETEPETADAPAAE